MAHPRWPQTTLELFAWFFFPFALIVAILAREPLADLSRASGLYAQQRAADGAPYFWTGSSATIPIRRAAAALQLTLSFGPAAWQGRASPTITLASDQGALASFPAPDQVRHYHLLLPPETGAIRIDTPVELPPDGEPRYLGATLYGVRATADGLPRWAIPPALGAGLLALLLWWSVRRGYGPLAGLFALALLLRTLDLDRSPPGWRVDEVVSLIDAWNLARTGRDHLGSPLPLGAFEALGDWISPLLTYLELPAVAVFGPQRLVGRLVVAVCGSLAPPLVYLLARRLDLPVAGALCAGLVAALSPWQIFMGRIALPPALVPTVWAACLLCGVILIQRGDRAAAIGLALAAGVGLYAYPTLKLAVPLLAAAAAGIALWQHGLRRARSWLPAALLVALLWAPFGYQTLLNPASATRLDQAALRAGTPGEWLGAWWASYSGYFSPAFYLRGDGSSIRSVPGYPIELTAGMPLALIGLIGLIERAGHRAAGARQEAAPSTRIRPAQPAARGLRLSKAPERESVDDHAPRAPRPTPLFILIALLIAPLAASLTVPSPHLYRAAPLAPLYALLVGAGVALLGRILIGAATMVGEHRGKDAGSGRANRPPAIPSAAPGAIGYLPWVPALALGLILALQLGGWWRAYTQDYPALQGALNQDGLAEAVGLAVRQPGFDEVWVSYNTINQPYLFVLASQALRPEEAQRQIVVERRTGRFNAVPSVGRYRFVNSAAIPYQLPALAAVPHRFGDSGYVLQRWEDQGRRILLVRRME